MAAVIAFVGAVPLAGVSWKLSPILLVPFLAGVWAWRAGTDVYPDRLKIRGLIGGTTIPWDRIDELAPDRNEQIVARLDNGNVIRLTGVTVANLSLVLKSAGRDPSVVADHPVEPGDTGGEPA